jgi:hypothetical protein
MASDSRTHPAFDNDARQAAGRVVDALSKWRNELAAANDRWLANALDQMSVAARTLGWPDSAVSGMREHLQGVSKMQAQIIDRFIDAWSGNLKVPPALKAVGPSFADRTPGVSAFSAPPGMSGMPFAPMDLWVQAAETWQRNWMSAMSLWADALPMSHTNGERERSKRRH